MADAPEQPKPGSTVPPTIQGVVTPAAPQTESGGRGSVSENIFQSARSIPPQDLSTDKLLLAAPRLAVGGKAIPSLGGIPLIAKLGQGGMGAVYYGIHPRLEKEVAVKVLPFHLGDQQPGLVNRFFREAQLAAKIESPHLVGVKDVNEDSGLFYLVMEFVNGQSVGAYLREQRSAGRPGLPEALALDICVAAAEGLAAAHLRGVIHRDIKPDNILIPKDERDGSLRFTAVKVADLGLARGDEAGHSLTGTQAAMGTPGYMSPEQAFNATKAGKASDVFSMGATLYALLCGASPFSGASPMEVILNTMQKPHTPVAQLRPDVSAVTAALLDRCLNKEPSQRYVDGSALREALKVCRASLGEPAATQQALAQLTLLQKAAEVGAPAPAPTAAPASAALTLAAPLAPAQPGSTIAPVTAATAATVATVAALQEKAAAPAKSALRWMGLVAVLLAGGLIAALLLSLNRKPEGLIEISNKNYAASLYFVDAAAFEKQYEKAKGAPLNDPELKDKLEKATKLVRAGELEAAIPLLQEAVKKLPEAALFNDLGVLYAGTQKIDEAQAAYKQAFDQNPEYEPAHFNLGLLKQSRGELQDAQTQFDKAAGLSEARQQSASIKKELSSELHTREIEPNNDLMHANTIPLGAPIQGAISPVGDKDCFSFKSLPKYRDWIKVTLENHSTTLQARLVFYNADKSALPEAGAGPGANVEYNLIAAPDQLYFVEIGSHWDQSAGDYTLTLTPQKAYDQYEPNDDILHATPISIGTKISANIMDNADRDFYQFETSAAAKRVTVQVDNESTTLGPKITAFNAEKASLSGIEESTPGANVSYSFDVSPKTLYYVCVESHWSSSLGKYALTATEK